MAVVTPTIHFNGLCEAAIQLYQVAFGATVDCLLHYSERNKQDWDAPLSKGQEDYVYHAEIRIGGQRLMMADNSEPDAPFNHSFFLTVTFNTAEEVQSAYDVLAKDGTVLVPIHRTTYSSCMGSLVDRFGIRWGLMTEQTER